MPQQVVDVLPAIFGILESDQPLCGRVRPPNVLVRIQDHDPVRQRLHGALVLLDVRRRLARRLDRLAALLVHPVKDFGPESERFRRRAAEPVVQPPELARRVANVEGGVEYPRTGDPPEGPAGEVTGRHRGGEEPADDPELGQPGAPHDGFQPEAENR